MIYAATCSGKHHTVSEDAVLLCHEVIYETSKTIEMPKNGFIFVADGVGGNRGGSQASRFVLEEFSKAKKVKGSTLKEFCESINEKLIVFAKDTPNASTMATTLTGVFVENGTYYLIHVGNTRAYVKQGNFLKQITSDHTTYNWLKSTGQLEAAENCNKNEITNCFGGGDRNLLSKLYISEIQSFSMMVLSSDGIHEYVDIDTMEELLSTNLRNEEKCQEILIRAMDNGSEDDMSIVLICPVE